MQNKKHTSPNSNAESIVYACASAKAQSLITRISSAIMPIAVSMTLIPLLSANIALAAEPSETELPLKPALSAVTVKPAQVGQSAQAALTAQATIQAQAEQESVTEHAVQSVEEKTNKVLAYNPDDIAAIGNQNESGHSICCPSYACAYADAVMDGTVHDHGYYSCSCCMWQDWGGGGSSFRCVGNDEQVLREAYDQIRAGKPTVTHVSWAGGEHWIALIGYQNATDPDHLVLENFIALDPSSGEQVNAASRFALYGDGCQHVSER